MSKNNETPSKTGTIDPKKTLPDFLTVLANQILHPYKGETHGCVANHEIAVAIEKEPNLFYGVPKCLVIWSEA